MKHENLQGSFWHKHPKLWLDLELPEDLKALDQVCGQVKALVMVVVEGGGGDQPGSWLVTEVTAELEERTIWLSVSLPDGQTLSMKAVPSRHP